MITASSVPPLPLNLFDPDKPVKVKSRWRRTSELEMGGTSGSSITSDSEVGSVTTMSVTSPELISSSVDPEVEEGLKAFEIIPRNIFLAPRFVLKLFFCSRKPQGGSDILIKCCVLVVSIFNINHSTLMWQRIDFIIY